MYLYGSLVPFSENALWKSSGSLPPFYPAVAAEGGTQGSIAPEGLLERVCGARSCSGLEGEGAHGRRPREPQRSFAFRSARGEGWAGPGAAAAAAGWGRCGAAGPPAPCPPPWWSTRDGRKATAAATAARRGARCPRVSGAGGWWPGRAGQGLAVPPAPPRRPRESWRRSRFLCAPPARRPQQRWRRAPLPGGPGL